MKTRTILAVLALAGMSAVCTAAPLRVLVTDFADQTGLRPDERLGGSVRPGAIADKGAFLLNKALTGKEGFILIDRRDYVAQVEKFRPTDSGAETPTRPTFIHAAQSLNADVVLRGSLLSFSTGKQVVDQGGFRTEFSTLSTRVAIEALDPVDGSVIAVGEGRAEQKFRQTESSMTVVSEDDALELVEKALAEALSPLEGALAAREAAAAERPKVKLTIKTSADPALVEIDGVLVGTTPVDGLEVYQGDHVLTIGKPGYRDVTKRIQFQKNASIEVPLIRSELSAEEMKEVLEKARLNIISTDGIEPALIIKEIE